MSQYDAIIENGRAQESDGRSYYQRQADAMAEREREAELAELQDAERRLTLQRKKVSELKSPTPDPFEAGTVILMTYRSSPGDYPQVQLVQKDHEGVWWLGSGIRTWKNILQMLRDHASGGYEVRVVTEYLVLPGGDRFDQVGNPVSTPVTVPEPVKRAYTRRTPAKKTAAKKPAAKKAASKRS